LTQVDPNNTVGESIEANNFKAVTANVGAGTVLYVTVVPIQQNNLNGAVPASWEQLLTKLWPLQNVDIKTHATFPSNRVLTSNASTNNDWGELLDDLANLRVLENSQRYYYGFAKVGYTSGVAGIGYVGYPVGMGWDYASSAPGITAHEIGHTFGLLHAPCGATSGLDKSYPVSNGKIDGWGFDVASLKLYDPGVNYDVMSYCGQNGKQWVSSYMYNKAQTALEADPPQATSVVNSAALTTADSGAGINERLVIVSGRIHNGAIELRPLEGFTGHASTPRPGEYTLRLETASGVTETPFKTQEIAHDDTSSFVFTVPDRGDVTAVEIRKDGTRLLRQTAGVRPLSVWTEPELREHAGKLELRWDMNAFHTATLVHVATDGERTVVGLQLERATTLDVRGLPAGGRFDLTLSDGLNSVQRTFQR
jgi:Peptidase M66